VRGRIGVELGPVHAEHREAGRRHEEVRDPRRHQVEHGGRPCRRPVDHQLGIQLADRTDGAVVDMGDEARRPVELAVGRRVVPVEEPVGEGVGHVLIVASFWVWKGCHSRRSSGVFMSRPRTPGGDMTSTTRVPPTEITGLFGTAVKVFSRKMLGHVPESMGVMWHHPKMLKDMMGLNRKAEKWGRLDESLGGLAHMAAAAEVGCSFCLDLNYFMAHTRGLDEAKAREVPRWRESTLFTPLERRVMEYAEAMSRTPVAVTDEMSAALLSELGAPALLELAGRVALMNASARTNIALGIHSEYFAESCGLPPLATASTDLGLTA
jgi:alkylhydroperoxidase family enzyme